MFNIREVMVLVFVSIHKARVSSTFFGGLKASQRWKFKKIIILENIKSNELSLVFSKIVSKGLCCDKVWGISIFPSCTPIRGILQKVALKNFVNNSFYSKYTQRKAFAEVLATKQAFLDNINTGLKRRENWPFCKADSPWFWSKSWSFFMFCVYQT